LNRRFLTLPCSTMPLSSQKTVTAGFYMRRVHPHQQDVERGTDCYTLASFQLGLIITGFPRGLRNLKNPPSTASPPSRPPPNINTNANQPISKNSKISIVSHESVV